MAQVQTDELNVPFSWPTEGVTRVPFRLFSDPEIHASSRSAFFGDRFGITFAWI